MDNLNKRNSPDSKRVNINEKHEMRYWTEALGCSEAELENAVKKVGTSAESVREYLQNHRK